MKPLSEIELVWLIGVLNRRAERKARGAAKGVQREGHPVLIEILREDALMCERVAEKLKRCAANEEGTRNA